MIKEVLYFEVDNKMAEIILKDYNYRRELIHLNSHLSISYDEYIETMKDTYENIPGEHILIAAKYIPPEKPVYHIDPVTWERYKVDNINNYGFLILDTKTF